MRSPACCLTCGYVSPSGVSVDSSTNFISHGNISTCPRCGGIAMMPDGIMEIFGNTVRLASGPEFTKEMFEAIGVVVEDLRQGKISLSQAIEKVTVVSPPAGAAFREWSLYGMAFIGMMCSVMSLSLQWQDHVKSNLSAEMYAEQAVDSFYSSGEPQFDHRSHPSFALRKPDEPQAEPQQEAVDQYKDWLTAQHGIQTSKQSLNRHERRAAEAKARKGK